jgi:two-component system, NarL family, sensor kinase
MAISRTLAQPAAVQSDAMPWRTLADGRRRLERAPAPTRFGTFSLFWLASSVALLSILLIGSYVSGRAAESEALRDARDATDLFARAVVEPALEDGLLVGDPGAIARLDAVVVQRVLLGPALRVKLWTAEGTIVYSDEQRLMGQTFPLDPEELEVLDGGPAAAEVSDLDAPENTFERSQGKLLEVYRQVALPNGAHLLFETYTPYSQVTERRSEVWRTFAPITLGALLLLQFCQLPLVWSLVRRLRAAQDERERLLRRAIEASNDERRRIAGNVHDSVVQGLAGASFAIAGAVDEVDRGGLPRVADELRAAASGIRQSIRGLRSMLVEIYPPSVSVAGLPAALHDLVAPLRAQGIDATATAPVDVELSRDVEALIFRVAQEALRNVAQHAGASTATVTLEIGPGVVRLEVADDGAGLDVDSALAKGDGHVGMKVLRDLAEESGALLQVASEPGAGTRVRLEVEVS